MADYVLKNECIQAQICTKSAELKSLKRICDGQEYLWNGGPEFWNRTSPVLFPAVGACRDDKYRYQGKEYIMEKHGFARNREFDVMSHTDTELWLSLEDDEKTYEVYPFHFRLEIGYCLNNATISVTWKVYNKDTDEMYFMIGGHPAILCPEGGKGSRVGWQLGFEIEKKELDYLLVDEETFRISSKIHKLPLENNMHKITKGMFDHDALIFEDYQVKTAFYADPEGKPYIKMHTQAPISAFWSPQEDAPFICFEPWFGRGDGVEFEGNLEERAWIQKLDGQSVFETSYALEIMM